MWPEIGVCGNGLTGFAQTFGVQHEIIMSVTHCISFGDIFRKKDVRPVPVFHLVIDEHTLKLRFLQLSYVWCVPVDLRCTSNDVLDVLGLSRSLGDSGGFVEAKHG